MGLRDEDIQGEKKKIERRGKNEIRKILIFLAVAIVIVAIFSYANQNKPEEKITATTTSASLQIQQTSPTTEQAATTTATETTTTTPIITTTIPSGFTTTTTILITTAISTTTTIDLSIQELRQIAEENKLVKDILAQEPNIEPRINKLSEDMINSFKESGTVPQDSSSEIYFVDYIKQDGQGVSLLIDLETKKILKTSVIVKLK